MTKKLQNLLLKRATSFYIKIQIAIHLSLGLQDGRPNYRDSRPPAFKEKNFQHFKTNTFIFINFLLSCGIYLTTWIRIPTQLGSGSSRSKSKQIHADPDPVPQCWIKLLNGALFCSYFQNLRAQASYLSHLLLVFKVGTGSLRVPALKQGHSAICDLPFFFYIIS